MKIAIHSIISQYPYAKQFAMNWAVMTPVVKEQKSYILYKTSFKNVFNTINSFISFRKSDNCASLT